MSEHNKSSSSDGSWGMLALPYEEFDVLARDINEDELEKIGSVDEDLQIDHLSEGSFPATPFPARGIIYSCNLRYMIPLPCQRAKKPNSRIVNVWFLLDTGSPFTTLTPKACEALFGAGNIPNCKFRIAIQDSLSVIECEVSKEHFNGVNLLGSHAMHELGVSVQVNWKARSFLLVKQ